MKRKGLLIVTGVILILMVIGTVTGNKNKEVSNMLSIYVDGTVEVIEKGLTTTIKIKSDDTRAGKVLTMLNVLKDNGYEAEKIIFNLNDKEYKINYLKNKDKIVAASTEDQTIELLNELSE